MNKLHYHIV